MQTIEFLGLPSSGKSTILKKLKFNLSIKNVDSISYINFLFLNNFKIKSFLLLILIFFLKKYKNLIFLKEKNKLNLEFFFKIIYINFLIFLLKKILKTNSITKFIECFEQILNLSDHSKIRKKRMKIYFLLKILAIQAVDKHKFYKDFFLIDDEGIYQSILISFKNFQLNKNKIVQLIKKFIKLAPSPDKIILVDSKLKKIINWSQKRRGGFKYSKSDLNNKLFEWQIIKFLLINELKKKKIKFFKLKTNSKHIIKKLETFIQK